MRSKTAKNLIQPNNLKNTTTSPRADQNNEVANNAVSENSGKFSKYVGYKEPENPINANAVSPDEVPLFDPMAEIPASSPVDNLRK
jgi:hypothetical protein